MGIINLKKSLTPEALAAMSRNTMVDGGGVNREVMEKFQQLLDERLAKIPNDNLKKAVEETVRQNATDKLMHATPKQVDKIVRDSFNEISKSIAAPAPKPKKKRKPRVSYPSWGGK